MTELNKKIKCSVGILTYNSEKNLRRALESVKEFSDIIISDGGSTDRTLEIAAEFNCKVVYQHSKENPSSNPAHPISDFSIERNILLKAASEDWFLYIDSDEYISTELREEIRFITSQLQADYMAYEVPIGNQSPDAVVTYRPWKQNYQIRFFNRKTGGRFERVMHERYVFDRDEFKVGRLKGRWYVPFSKPDFASYRNAVDYRLRVLLKEHIPKNFFSIIFDSQFASAKEETNIVLRFSMSSFGGFQIPVKCQLQIFICSKSVVITSS